MERNGTGKRLYFCRRCLDEVQSVQRDGAGVIVTRLDIERVRSGAEVGGNASGAGEWDVKTVARR